MNLEQMLARQQAILDAAKAEQRDLNETEQREFDMLQHTITALRSIVEPMPSGSNNPKNNEEIERQAIENERQRTMDIDNLCRSFGYDANEYIKDGKSIDEVRTLILEKQLKDKKPLSVSIVKDEGDKFREAAKDGLALRAGLTIDKPAEGANEIRNLSLKDLARESARMEGANNAYRLSEDELLRQYMTPTSLFTGIMDQTARISFEQAYLNAETTYQLWTKRGTLKDFRPTKTYATGTAGSLLLVPENGELKHDMVNAEEGPTRQLLTFGRQFSMSRQAFINDDVDFISTIPALYAQSARLDVNRIAYQMLATNPVIWTGNQFFSSQHNNISDVDGNPSVETVSDMRMKMRNQKAVGGDVFLNIPAKFMIVPTTLETMAGQFVGSPVDPAQTNPNIKNPFYNSLQLISDPELDSASVNGIKEWYLLGDQMRSPIQVDFLNGIDMPTIAMKQAPPGQLGYLWDIHFDYAVTIVNYKTAVKNNGL